MSPGGAWREMPIVVYDSSRMDPALTCSVVVCTRDRPEVLNRCLEALSHQAYPHVEVLVVDNAPRDGRAQVVAQRWDARYLVEPVAGLSRARNTGARACTSQIVAFTDDDAVPEAEWLSTIASAFSDPTVTVVTGRTLPLARSVRPWPMAQYTADLGQAAITLDRTHRLWFEMACFGGIGRGCNMAFRRSIFDLSDVFDERLGKGVLANGDEHRAFGHLVAHGYAVRYTPQAVVRHPIPQTIDELREQYLQSLCDLTGYATFLFVATPFRWKVMKYVVEAVLGTKRTWRRDTEGVPRHLVPRWRMLVAYAEGVWECLRSHTRLRHQSHVPATIDVLSRPIPSDAATLRLVEK